VIESGVDEMPGLDRRRGACPTAHATPRRGLLLPVYNARVCGQGGRLILETVLFTVVVGVGVGVVVDRAQAQPPIPPAHTVIWVIGSDHGCCLFAEKGLYTGLVPAYGVRLGSIDWAIALIGPNAGISPAPRLLDVTELQALALEHTELGCAELSW